MKGLYHSKYGSLCMMENEPPHDETNKVALRTNEDSDQPGQPPNLIRVFAVGLMGSYGPSVSSCGQRRL